MSTSSTQPQSINSWKVRSVESNWDRERGERGNHVLAGQWNLISLLHLTCWNSAGKKTRQMSEKTLRIRNFITFFCFGKNHKSYREACSMSNISTIFHNARYVWSPDILTQSSHPTCNLAACQTCQRWHVSCHDVISRCRSSCLNKHHLGWWTHSSQHSGCQNAKCKLTL